MYTEVNSKWRTEMNRIAPDMIQHLAIMCDAEEENGTLSHIVLNNGLEVERRLMDSTLLSIISNIAEDSIITGYEEYEEFLLEKYGSFLLKTSTPEQCESILTNLFSQCYDN